MFPRARCADAAMRAEWLVNVLMIGVFHASLKSMLHVFLASWAAFLNNYFSVPSALSNRARPLFNRVGR